MARYLSDSSSSISESSEQSINIKESTPPTTRRPTTFWFILFAICMALFLSAFELTGVSTALPTIVEDIPNFQPSHFIWVGSSYALSGTAFLPLSGSLAQILGRPPVLQASLVFFALGNAICGAAGSSSILIVGRTIQGLGGGGIVMLSNLIIADLVPLEERGKYNGFLSFAWCIAAVLGPPVCGALADAGLWRWVFYLNVPVTCFVIILVFFLRLKTPKETFSSRVKRVDYGGNIIIIGSTTACVLALTWGGSTYPWASYQVLVPLIMGLVGLIAFLFYEHWVPVEPTTPLRLFSNRTSLSGYIQTFLIQFLLLAFIYYIPVYFQAVKLHTPRLAGSDLLSLAITLCPSAIVVGLTLALFRCYRPQLWVGWVVTIVGFACLSLTMHVDGSIWTTLVLTSLLGIGIGTVYTTTMIATLSTLPVEENASAIASGMFLRMFGQVWGIAIGGTILQNRIEGRLSEAAISHLPTVQGIDVAYGSVALVRQLSDDVVRRSVQTVFAESLSMLWVVMSGLAALGFCVSLCMKGVPMHRCIDEKWGQEFKQEDPRNSVENC